MSSWAAEARSVGGGAGGGGAEGGGGVRWGGEGRECRRRRNLQDGCGRRWAGRPLQRRRKGRLECRCRWLCRRRACQDPVSKRPCSRRGQRKWCEFRRR